MFNEIKQIILEAGEIFKDGYNRTQKEVQLKGKKDLVTKYDVEIEKFLKNTLLAKFPEFNVVAEESFNDSKIENTFIIDPIDGTTNFFHQVPHCAISVAVYANAKPKFAFVYNPILEEFFWAKKGEGAYLNEKKINVSEINNFQRALIATGFPYSSAEDENDLNWVISKLKKVLPRCQDIRRLGSASLDLCYVACGKFEGFYEINLKPWDVAAGMLIVEEAGGVVTDSFGEKYNFLQDYCIVASNGFIHDKLVSLLE